MFTMHITIVHINHLHFRLDYFENLNVISSSFDGYSNTPIRTGKFLGATDIFKKKEGCNFCNPRCWRVKIAPFVCHTISHNILIALDYRYYL